MNDRQVSKNNLDETEQKKIAEINAMMRSIYEFLEKFSIAEKPETSEYANLIASLKTFEEEMIKESKSRKEGDWRDPVNTIRKLEDTIHQVFDPKNDSVQRAKAIGDFQVHARNAALTTREKIELARTVTYLGMAASAISLMLAPPLGLFIACTAVTGLAVIASIAILAQALYTYKNQDPKRGLAVTTSLEKLNEKHTASCWAFFNRPKEKPQVNALVSLSPAFKLS